MNQQQPVPFVDLRRFEDGFLDAWAARVADISAGTRFVGGPDVARLEARLAEAAGAGAVVGCANGTDALQLALRAIGVGQGDVVVVPDATFWATFEAVVNVGARVVTVDIDPVDLQMDFDRFVQAVDRYRPRAAILVHLYGWGSRRLDDLRAFCAGRGLPLVEDGAQVWGAEWRGEPVFAGAEVATVSFYPAKVLGACGDSGAVVCRDPALAAAIRTLGNHGRTDHYAHGVVGWNSRMGGLDAAWLDLCLDHLPERLASRRRAAARYRVALDDIDGVRLVGPPVGWTENGYLSVLLLEPERKAALENALRHAGIGFGNTYPGSLSRQPGARGHLAGAVGGAEAARLGAGVLNLPLFAHIAEHEVERVIAVVREALGAGRPSGSAEAARVEADVPGEGALAAIHRAPAVVEHDG